MKGQQNFFAGEMIGYKTSFSKLRYFHWNHPYLPNWDKRDHKKYPNGSHDPAADDIGSNFFPQCGIYSSRDSAVIQQHMKQFRLAGAGTLVKKQEFVVSCVKYNSPPHLSSRKMAMATPSYHIRYQ